MFTNPAVFETKDGPNAERYSWNDGTIPKLFDISALIKSASSAVSAAEVAEGGEMESEAGAAEKMLEGFNIGKYFQYLH